MNRRGPARLRRAAPRLSLVLPGLRIFVCRACGHREAIHDAEPDTGRDYHGQYDEGAFLDALRATRLAAGRLLIGLLKRQVPDLSRVVGSAQDGDGFSRRVVRLESPPWLESTPHRSPSRASGRPGIDTSAPGTGRCGSPVAALLPPAGALSPRRPRALPPRPARGAAAGNLECMRGRLELVMVKVPVAGLLYTGASALSRVGVAGPLRQLYQAGTWPPHFNYFSPASAERLFAAARLSVIERVGDLDFEPHMLGKRIGATRPSREPLRESRARRWGRPSESPAASTPRSFSRDPRARTRPERRVARKESGGPKGPPRKPVSRNRPDGSVNAHDVPRGPVG